MTRKYFGTDGVRGRVGETPITPDFVMKLGQAAGRVLRRRIDGRRHVRVVIGKDTRVSGYMLEAALQAGFSSAGVDVVLCGPIPTPAIAYLTRAQRADAGVVITTLTMTTVLNSFLSRGQNFLMKWNWKSKKSWTRAFPVWTAANWVRLGGLKMLRVDTSNFVNPRLTAQSI